MSIHDEAAAVAERPVMSVFDNLCSLAELIDDPITGLVMKSNGVDRQGLELLLAQIAQAIVCDLTRKPLSASANRGDGAMLTLPSS